MFDSRLKFPSSSSYHTCIRFGLASFLAGLMASMGHLEDFSSATQLLVKLSQPAIATPLRF